MEQYERYIKNVLAGVELVSETTRLTITRHLNDLKKSPDEFGFYFDEKEAGKAIGFLKALRHPSGNKGIANERFNLQDNQAFITAVLFGWRRVRDGKRRFTESYLEVSRKWGKSLFAAFIEIYIGFYEGNTGAGVFTAATTREQADEVFRAVHGFAERLRADSPKARKDIIIRANSVNHKNGSFIQKVSAEAKNLDGKNPVCAVIDEKHAHPDDSVKDVMESGMGTWDAPMLFTITTAGFQKYYPCYKVDRPHAVSVLKGEIIDDGLFAMIFCHDNEETADDILLLDPDDKEQAAEIIRLAKKSNPNLGSTPTEDFILKRVRAARNKGSYTRVGVLTKNFNCWLDAPKIWIPEEKVKSCMRPISFEEFAGRVVYTSFDLAATSDITALNFYASESDGQRAIHKTVYFLPEATVDKRKHDVPYEQWARDGYLVLTPGETANYGFMKNIIREQRDKMRMGAIAYDKWNAWETAAELESEGLEMVPVLPYYSHLSPPTKAIEKEITSNLVDIDENPVTVWMYKNVTLDMDSQENIKPNKKRSREKIDGVVAQIMSKYLYFFKGTTGQGSYLFDEEEELIIIG